MITALIILICIITVLLILIVLIQNSKGGGLTGEFGGLGSNQLMGVKKTTDLLEQITWGLGIAMMVLSLATYVLVDRNQAGSINSANVDRAQTQTLPGAAAPNPGAAGAAPSQAIPGRSADAAATPGVSASALTPQK
jgi:preprotein translocase subunit SecG